MCSHTYIPSHVHRMRCYICVCSHTANMCPHTDVRMSSQAHRLVTWWSREEPLMRAAVLKTSNPSTSRFSSALYTPPLWILGQRGAWYSSLKDSRIPLALIVQQYNYCRNSRCNSRCHCGSRGSGARGTLRAMTLSVHLLC